MLAMRKLRLVALVGTLALLIVLTAVPVLPQSSSSDSCTVLIDSALAEVGDNCAGTERNASCYGYNRVNASFTTEVAPDFFSKPADRAPLADLQTISTAALNLENGEWGVALLNVQANVPNTLPGQAVTFILMGDVEITNDVAPEDQFISDTQVEVVANAGSAVNLRTGPGTNYNVATAIDDGTPLIADGVDASGSWLRVSVDDKLAWIARFLVSGEGIDTLPTITETTRTPMQAFYFNTGIGTTQCTEAPDSLIVQSPDNITVDLTVNGAEINLGSTVILVNNELSYADASTNSDLVGRYGSTLTGRSIPADATCQVTDMIMLDGLAVLNDRNSLLPVGHVISSVACIDTQGQNLLTTPWRGLRQLTQDELQTYAIIEKMPTSILPKNVKIPTDQEILREYRLLFPDTLDPTETPPGGEGDDGEATPTPNPGGDPIPTPTDIPPEVTPAP